MKVANKNSERLELKELFLSYLPPLHAVSALFCKLCELNVRIFVRNSQFFNLSNGIHDSAMIFSSKDEPQ